MIFPAIKLHLHGSYQLATFNYQRVVSLHPPAEIMRESYPANESHGGNPPKSGHVGYELAINLIHPTGDPFTRSFLVVFLSLLSLFTSCFICHPQNSWDLHNSYYGNCEADPP
jgi:hypothetical protein